MLSGTNSSLSLSGCGARHNLHGGFPARGTDQSDTESMPRNATVSVNIPGWTVESLGPHEPCRTDRPVDSTIILQSPAAPEGSATSPARMEVRVSDVTVSTLTWRTCRMVGVLNSTRSQRSGHHPSSVRPYHRDRCIITGLGRNLQWHVDGGTLEHGGGRTTHQLSGTQGSHSILRVGMQPPPQSLGHHPPRHILLEMENTTAVAYVNRRGHSVTISVPTSLGTLVLPADSGLMCDSPSLTRSVECGSRRSFEGIQHAHRVDASAGCLSRHSTSLLCSGDRPICVAFEPSATSLGTDH